MTHSYKIERRRFTTKEIESWLLIALLILGWIFLGQFFTTVKSKNMWPFFITMCVLKIANNITQYYVSEIRIIPSENALEIVLRTRMTETKIKRYPLDKINSEYKIRNTLLPLLINKYELTIYLPKNEMFKITDRYGFTPHTLQEIDNTLNLHITGKYV